MTDVDRNAILARRALFISAALAGLACTTHDDLPAQNRPEERETAKPIVETPPTDEPSQGDDPERQRPPWSEVMAKAPPLDVPTGLSKSEHEFLEGLTRGLEAKYEHLRAVWELPNDCSPSDSGCTVWSQSIQAMIDAWPDDGPLCGYSPEWTGTLEQRARAHDRYLEDLRVQLLADLDATAKRWPSTQDVDAWEAERQPALLGPPRPCLSCARPQLEPILISIVFASNEATLGTNLDSLQQVLAQHKQNGNGARLVVRGHADPSESDGDRLAKERAEAVAKWLIAAGVRKADIEVRSHGSTLLVSRESAENQRVDFEIVPR
jgi:outer membrane protein OmpA-like peptidoglycan-associated protein